jgi:type II secretory pathway predicted ATPase ExeA
MFEVQIGIFSIKSLGIALDSPRWKEKTDIVRLETLLDALIKSSQQRTVTVIPDEANIAFQKEKFVFADELMQLMTRLTKQSNKVCDRSELSLLKNVLVTVYVF